MVERIVSLAVLAASGAYLAGALALPVGTAARPGPGFFPLAVGAFAVAVALVWAAIAFRRSPTAPAPSAALPAAEGRRRVLATAAVLVGFCLLLPRAGYPLSAVLFVTVLLRNLGARWPAAVATGLVSAAASYYLFGVLLSVPLPRGFLLD
jgi:hypothetical protein